ncbi:MAG: hypothetical protein K2M01_02020 [Paramuribaculum sp.]|nr:hypothetical protein [Paramuribaculum sp.]
MKKFIISGCLAICLGLFASAENSYKSMVLNNKEGEKIIQVNFNSGLTVSLADNTVAITGLNASKESFTLSYPMENVGGWNFSETTGEEITGIGNVSEESPLNVTLVADGVMVAPLTPGSHISVCDLSGRVTYSVVSANENSVVIPYASLTRGVNILTVNNQSFKFTVNQ